MREANDQEHDLAATVRALSAEVERLRALVDHRSEPVVDGAPPAPAAPTAARESGDEPVVVVDRRGAMKRAGMLAAGAVAGGAAIVAATASPAAAETVTGSGNPGVIATGTAGDGLQATTSHDFSYAVSAVTSRGSGYALYAQNEGGGGGAGTAIYAVAPGRAVDAHSGAGPAGYFETGSTATTPTLQVKRPSAAGVGFRVDTAQDGAQIVSTASVPTATGYYARNFVYGADVVGCTVGGRFEGVRAALNLPTTNASITSTAQVRALGDLVMETGTHDLYLCVAGSGATAVFRKVSGPKTAGAFHVLPKPVRLYDSRPGTTPNIGSKTPLKPGVARTIDLKGNGSGVPVGATAALVTILLVNATAGNGNLTLWANETTPPAANTMVWGGSAGRFTAKEVSAASAQAEVQVVANLKTDIVVDVVGYYR